MGWIFKRQRVRVQSGRDALVFDDVEVEGRPAGRGLWRGVVRGENGESIECVKTRYSRSWRARISDAR